MVSILSLWAPILVGAILVFVSSSIIHMVLTYHHSDFSKVADEDGVMDAMHAFAIPPGDYVVPFAGGAENMRSEAFLAKVEKGPVLFMTVLDGNRWLNMAPNLAQWFLYSVLIGIFAAYLGGRMLPAGAEYLDVFRLTGTVAFACYSMALMQRSIWFHQNWKATLKSMFDGLIYALLTAGAFGWLWPS